MPSWKPVLVLAVLACAALFVLMPNYVDMQSAPTPAIFRGELGDHERNALLAALADLAFAALYGLLGVIAFDAVATGLLRVIGTVLIVGAAVADEIENVLLMINIGNADTVTQGAVDAVGTAGDVKYVLLAAGIILFLALAGQRFLDRRRG